MGSCEHLADFTIEQRVNHIFCCASSPVSCYTYVNAQVPAIVNVVTHMYIIVAVLLGCCKFCWKYTDLHTLGMQLT